METHHLPVRPKNGGASGGSVEGMKGVVVATATLADPLKQRKSRDSFP